VYTGGVVGIAVLGLVVRLWLGLQFTWLTDDWTYIVRSNTLSLPRFLMESYNGHVGPGQFLVVWLVAKVAPLSFVHATLVASLVGAAALLAWGIALRKVFGPRPQLLLPLAVMAFSPMTLWAGLWWASAVQAGPLQLCTAAMVFFGAAWVSSRSSRNLTALVVCFVLGLLFWEKALLAVIPVLAVVWMMTPGTVRQRFRSGAPVLVALATTSVVYLGLYIAALRIFPGTWYAISEVDVELSAAHLGELATGVLVASRDVLAPGLVGGPWELIPFGLSLTLPGASWVATVVAGFFVVVLVVRGVCRRHGMVPVLVVLLYVGVALSLTSMSTTSAVIGVDAMKNPRLLADPLSVTLLALALLLLPTAPERKAGSPRDWAWVHAHAPARVVNGALVVVTVAVAVGLAAGVRGLWIETRDRPAMGWSDNVRGGIDADRPVLLADGRPPVEVYPFGFWPDEAWLSKMLSGVPGARFSGSGPELSMVDEDGHVVQARVERQAGTLQGPVAGCGYAIAPGRRVQLPLDADLISWNWGVEASFVAGGDASLVLEVDGTDIPMEVSAGVSTVVAPVNSAVTEVSMTAADDAATVCLVGLAFGPAVPADA
jgi:hypothetical protein